VTASFAHADFNLNPQEESHIIQCDTSESYCSIQTESGWRQVGVPDAIQNRFNVSDI
jgi:hypothetical protein